MLSYVLIVIIFVLVALYFISQRKYNYWKKRGIPYLKPTPILGNYGRHILMQQHVSEVGRQICEQFDDEPIVGAFLGTEPILLVQDPEMVKTVLSKDFYFFSSRDTSDYNHKEMVFRNLFSNYGDEWKVLRQNLTPLFSSAKMKNMFPLIVSCTQQFDGLLNEVVESGTKMDVKSIVSRFTMDCLCSCAFGINSNAMSNEITNNPFRNMADTVFEISYKQGFKGISRSIWPGIFYGLRQRLFDEKAYNFFNGVLTEVYEERQYKPSARNDFVDAMLNLYNGSVITGDSIECMNGGSGKVSLKVDNNMLVAQCFIFFSAGFDTSATTLTFTLYELAKHPDLQERAIAEIDNYLRNNGNILDYSVVSSLPFVESCIDEALRLYPIIGQLPRELYRNYRLPNGAVLDAGLRVHIPVLKIHRSPKNFTDPDKYDPDRFSPDRKHEIKPFSYLPFGEGPRHCIGLRFAKMMMLSGLVSIFRKYRVTPTEDTPKYLTIEPKFPITLPRENLALRLELRK